MSPVAHASQALPARKREHVSAAAQAIKQSARIALIVLGFAIAATAAVSLRFVIWFSH
jgi:hypothetical protein